MKGTLIVCILAHFESTSDSPHQLCSYYIDISEARFWSLIEYMLIIWGEYCAFSRPSNITFLGEPVILFYISRQVTYNITVWLSILHLSFDPGTHLMYIVIIRDNDVYGLQQLHFRIRCLYSYSKIVQSEQIIYSFNVLIDCS
jgi:hypothetical protein